MSKFKFKKGDIVCLKNCPPSYWEGVVVLRHLPVSNIVSVDVKTLHSETNDFKPGAITRWIPESRLTSTPSGFGSSTITSATSTAPTPRDYVEVRRLPKFGEYIKITNPFYSFEREGDILRVTDPLCAGVHFCDYPFSRNVPKPKVNKGQQAPYWYHTLDQFVTLEGYER